MKKWDVEHRTSSPGYPKSNGMVESAVKNAKKIISRALEDGTDPHAAILEYRNTPQADGLSPAQKFLGRRTRTSLPTTTSLMQPRGVDTKMYTSMRRLKNARASVYYDRYCTDLEALKEGDSVRIKPMTLGNKIWKKGVISKRLDERSLVHLKKTNEKMEDEQQHEKAEQKKQTEDDKEKPKQVKEDKPLEGQKQLFREKKVTDDTEMNKQVAKDTEVNKHVNKDNEVDKQLSTYN